MILEDILNKIYEDTEFLLFEDGNARIGKFCKKDRGLDDYRKRDIDLIEPNDNKSIMITLD